MVAVDDEMQDIKDNLILGTYAAAVTGGKTYGLNQFTGIFGFERNPNVIEKAGLDPSQAARDLGRAAGACPTDHQGGQGRVLRLHPAGPCRLFRRRHLPRGRVPEAGQRRDVQGRLHAALLQQPERRASAHLPARDQQVHPSGPHLQPGRGPGVQPALQGHQRVPDLWLVARAWAKDSGLDNAMYSASPSPRGARRPVSWWAT